MHVETLRAFSEDEFRRIVAVVPWRLSRRLGTSSPLQHHGATDFLESYLTWLLQLSKRELAARGVGLLKQAKST